MPLLVDVAAIGVVVVDLITFVRTGSAEPNIRLQILVVLVPAVVSFALVVALLRRSRETHDASGLKAGESR